MKEKRLRHKEEALIPLQAGAFPTLIAACPKCGGEIELWSPSGETSCIFCNYKVFDHEGTVH